MKFLTLKREISAEGVKIDEQSRLLTFSFSSELPVERFFGREILSHDPKAADLSRMNNGASVLFNHNMDDLVGVVEKAWIKDQRGYCEIRFSKRESAIEIMNDVRDGIIRNVSFGYMIHDMKLTKSEDGVDEYTATKWEPYEVSFVTIPADPSVGVGRSKEAEAFVRSFQSRNDGEVTEATPQVDPHQENSDEGKGTPEMTTPNEKPIDVAAERAAARQEAAAIYAYGKKLGLEDLARQLVEGGKSLNEAREAFLDKAGVKQIPVSGTEADVGLTDKEVRTYSVTRLMHALANPADNDAREAAKFELEVSRAAQAKSGRAAKGAMIPVDILRAGRRDLVVGTPTAGGNLVAEDLQAGSFISLLRNKAVVNRLGAQSLNGLVGNIAIPRQSGAATAYWVGEQVDVTKSQQAIDQVQMSPKTVGARTEYSRNLLIQSSIDVENMVRNDLATVLALEIDRVALYGSGSASQPLGLKFQTGLNTVDLAAAAATYAEIVDMETKVASDNADIGTLKYVTNALGRGLLKTTEKATSTGIYLWEPGNTVNGYGCEVSNQIATLSSTDPDFFFGNWADLILGFWGGLDIVVDPYSGSAQGTVRVVAFQSMDVAVRHGESFCYANKTISL